MTIKGLSSRVTVRAPERALQTYDDEQQRDGNQRLAAVLAESHRPNQQDVMTMPSVAAK